MQSVQPPTRDTLLGIEQRHEDLLRRLDELEQKVARVLAECLTGQRASPSAEQA